MEEQVYQLIVDSIQKSIVVRGLQGELSEIILETLDSPSCVSIITESNLSLEFKYENRKQCDLYINDQQVKLHRILEVDANDAKKDKKKLLTKLNFNQENKEEQSSEKVTPDDFKNFQFSPSL